MKDHTEERMKRNDVINMIRAEKMNIDIVLIGSFILTSFSYLKNLFTVVTIFSKSFSFSLVEEGNQSIL